MAKTQEESERELAGNIGAKNALVLTDAMKKVRDDMFALAEKEEMSEEGLEELKELFKAQFKLGMKSVRMWMEAKKEL